MDKIEREWQKLTSDLDSTVEFYNSEDITVRIHFLGRMMQKAPYHYGKGGDYWVRIQNYLEGIPKAHHRGALALFGAVLYLPRVITDETMGILAADIREVCAADDISLPGEAHVFTVDHPGLVDLLYDRGHKYGWEGRLDQLLERDVSTAKGLLELAWAVLQDPPEATKARDLRAILEKRAWILLTDNALSGTSVRSDARRLQMIANSLCPEAKPRILVAAQIVTQKALDELHGVVAGENVLYGLLLGPEFQVNSDVCALFRTQRTLEDVRRFCVAFGEEYFGSPLFLSGPADFLPTLRDHRNRGGLPNFAYGWMDCGLTLVTESNAPTNSVPALWYPTVNAGSTLFLPGTSYNIKEAVFPRNHSRPQAAKSRTESLASALAEGSGRLREVLWGTA